MNKIIDFVKYHNAFAIGISLIFILAVGALASEDVRNAVVGEEIVTKEGIDNSEILSADLEDFDLELKIKNVSEDEENYYVDYSYKTFGIKENKWQELLREKTLTVSKEELGEEDLGLFVLEELGEVADYELSYLKEVQEIEKTQGLKTIVTSVEYTGLKGLVLDIKDKALPGYSPIVEEVEQPQLTGVYQPKTMASTGTSPSSPPSLSSPSVVPTFPVQPALPAEPSLPTSSQSISQGEVRSIVLEEIGSYLAEQVRNASTSGAAEATAPSSQEETSQSLVDLEARLLREDGPLQALFQSLDTEQERQEKTNSLKAQIDQLWQMLQQLKEMEEKY